jgi:hypothetical protein
MTQIQVIREGHATVIYRLDADGRVWRSLPQTAARRYVIKWLPVEGAESARAPAAAKTSNWSPVS